MEHKTPTHIKKKCNRNSFFQNRILEKSCFNDSNRISTIPEGTIINGPNGAGVNLRELLARVNEKKN